MKQRFVFLFLSLFSFLRALLAKKAAAGMDSAPAVSPIRFIMERRPGRFVKKSCRIKRSAVKQRVYPGRRWRAHYRAIREFRLAPASGEPTPDRERS